MKSIEVRCPSCKGRYETNEFNTKFYGPYMRSDCPNCEATYKGKFLTFVVRQYYNERVDERDRFNTCKSIISLAQEMDSQLNPEPMKVKAPSK